MTHLPIFQCSKKYNNKTLHMSQSYMYVQNNLRKTTFFFLNNLFSVDPFALVIMANTDVRFLNLTNLKHIFVDSEIMRIPYHSRPSFMSD